MAPTELVELVYDADCPNVGAARAELLRAFGRAGLAPRWQEWRAGDPAAPPHVRGYGSPTVLVDGRDVAGEAPGAGGRSCRLYAGGDGAPRGAPPLAAIVAALRRLPPAVETRRRWQSGAATALAVGAALLPKLACPACWPAYAGLVSSLGLGFLLDAAVLLPLTAAFLAIALLALAWGARRRRGHGPFTLGLAAAAVVLVGKFAWESGAATYAGLAVLLAASAWNSWPLRRQAAACGADCAAGQPAQTTGPLTLKGEDP